MSETPSELSDVFGSVEDMVPEKTTAPEIKPCTCGLSEGMYNQGLFHCRNGQVVGKCHEYEELTAAYDRGKKAAQIADPFSMDTNRLKTELTLLKVRLDELKAGGVNR